MIERVACYIRVSTEEQKLHGMSLDAQIDKLTEYAQKHDLKIVEWYKDEGVSGRKLIKKRPELQHMLNDAQAKKFDRILFIKLDRFFRSVAEYHECMKLIDPVIWTATEEKYDLSTANGRAFVNMKLTIAELEADQTGERIKIVNDYKIKTGQAITGGKNQGLGWTVKKIDGIKRVVKNPETAHIIDELIQHYLTHQSKNLLLKWLFDTYKITLQNNQLNTLLKNTKLYGSYRNNPNYCEPYIDKATFDKIQEIMKRNIKKTPSKNIYLFTGLIKCPKCGRNMTCLTNGKYINYKCNYSYDCRLNKTKSERYIEKYLFDNFDKLISYQLNNLSISDTSNDYDNNIISEKINTIKSEINRVNIMFRKNRISESEYDREYSELESELTTLQSKLQITSKERDLKIYEDLLKSDWKALYEALTKENKRAFWRKYIKNIVVDTDLNIIDIIMY